MLISDIVEATSSLVAKVETPTTTTTVDLALPNIEREAAERSSPVCCRDSISSNGQPKESRSFNHTDADTCWKMTFLFRKAFFVLSRAVANMLTLPADSSKVMSVNT